MKTGNCQIRSEPLQLSVLQLSGDFKIITSTLFHLEAQ